MKIKSNVSVALLKGVYAGTFVDLAVDADGNMITILRGADGNDVAVDGSGYLSTAIKGKHGAAYSDVGVDASGNLITIIRGAAGNDVGVDASGNLTAIIRGSTGVINQDASGNLAAAMKGLEGANVRDIAVDASGQMISIMKGAAGNNVAVDASGRLAAMMKGLEGATVRDIAVDASGNMIAIMRGAAGNDVAVDVSGNLTSVIHGSTGVINQDASGNLVAAMKGLEGANVRNIAVDASGNMISVMKGNYGGVLKTWKVDTDGRGEMFISDPTDVWGNIVPMGLAEHAARTHAPPMTFDRRGDVLRWVDFESATPNYIIDTVGSPTYGRTCDTAANGNFSYKSSLNNNGDSVDILVPINDFHNTKVGVQSVFATASTDLAYYLLIAYYDGANVYSAWLYYMFDSDIAYIRVAGGASVSIGTIHYFGNIHNFSSMKLVIDINTQKYVRAIVFGTEFDISAYSLYSGADASAKHIMCGVYNKSIGSGVQTSYTDDIIITENEPEN